MDYINSVKVRLTYKEINEGQYLLLTPKRRALTKVLSILWAVYLIILPLILPASATTYMDVQTTMTETINSNMTVEKITETDTDTTDSEITIESDTDTTIESNTDTSTDTQVDSEENLTSEDETTYDETYDDTNYIEPIETPTPTYKENAEGYRYQPTETELYYFYKIVQCEIGGGTYESKLRVCQVILNRIESSRFPNNMYDVIFAPDQFTPALNGAIYDATPSEDVIEACNDSLLASTPDYTDGALFFMLGVYDFTWATYKFTDESGHSFYE